MRMYKQELVIGQEIDLRDDEKFRYFHQHGVTNLSVFLIEIHGVSNPSTLSIKFLIDTKERIYSRYTLNFVEHRLNLVFENGIYFFNPSKIKVLQSLPVKSTFKLRIENEDKNETPKVILFCKTDSTIDFDESKTEYL